jgi:hypothetical protein
MPLGHARQSGRAAERERPLRGSHTIHAQEGKRRKNKKKGGKEEGRKEGRKKEKERERRGRDWMHLSQPSQGSA